jgi:hypothetical protein
MPVLPHRLLLEGPMPRSRTYVMTLTEHADATGKLCWRGAVGARSFLLLPGRADERGHKTMSLWAIEDRTPYLLSAAGKLAEIVGSES